MIVIAAITQQFILTSRYDEGNGLAWTQEEMGKNLRFSVPIDLIPNFLSSSKQVHIPKQFRYFFCCFFQILLDIMQVNLGTNNRLSRFLTLLNLNSLVGFQDQKHQRIQTSTRYQDTFHPHFWQLHIQCNKSLVKEFLLIKTNRFSTSK